MILRLLAGTVVHRPYVYAFFACFLFFAWRQLRARDTLIYLGLSYALAFGAEYSSTRNGFPFGVYVYLDRARAQELWISNIPFWDSLSFVFLSYFSWIVAAAALDPREPSRALLRPAAAGLAGLLMMLLDVVIDPLTLLGGRWFLGKIYYYPDGGSYFGVTLANFAGWFFLGALTIGLFQGLARLKLLRPARWHALGGFEAKGTLGVYGGVLIFNLLITAWIREWPLLAASSAVTCLALTGLLTRVCRRNRRRL